ncbi:MAG TPA: S9 family peptidase [Sumerlaeia bacterium]|nr:S9 family peptidase [Sumerlaeia bacterium]
MTPRKAGSLRRSPILATLVAGGLLGVGTPGRPGADASEGGATDGPKGEAQRRALEERVVPPENLVLDGIPEVPASIAEAVRPYAEFRSARFLSWHPARREMLVGTRFANTTQVHRVTHPGGARRQLTFFREPVGWASYQPEDGRFFCFLKDRGGDEFYQVFRFDPDGGPSVLITDGEKRNEAGPWSNSGGRLAYRRLHADEKEAATELRIVEPTDPATDRVAARLRGGGWRVNDWSPDDRTLLALEYISVNESYVWLVNAESGETKCVTPRRKAEGDPGARTKVAYGASRFAADGKSVYAVTDLDSEFRRLARLDLESGQYAFLTESIPWDVSTFEISPDFKTIAFLTNEEGVGVLHLLDAATGKEKPVPKLPVGVISGIEWRENGRDLAFNVNGARSTSDVYSLDVETGKVEQWTYSETGGLNTDEFVEPELIRWKSFDGRTISGFLYLPSRERFKGKRPVIINIHGGPEAQARPGFLGRNNHFLNDLGVAIIFPNVRGSTGYGKTFAQLDNGFKREDSYKDIGALLDWIATRSELDSQRIMVTGGSYGGHMTLAVATRYNDRIACSVSVVGISNLRTFLENTQGYRRDLRRAEYGDERDPEMRAFLDRASPMAHADKIRKPIFVIQGRNDPRVPISEADQIVQTVRDNGIPVWYLVADDEGHGFRKKENADFQFYATVAFVREFLLGE